MIKRLTFIGLLAAFATGSALAQTSGFAAFTAPLSPSSENPPISGADINGSALVLIHMTRDSAGALTQAVVDFHIDVNTGSAQTITAMHIHRAARGSNGPVVIDSMFGSALELAPGSHRLFRQNVVTSETGLATVTALLANPAGYYVNMHSMSNPGGIIRGQLEISNASQFSALQTQIAALQASNDALAAELGNVKATLARVARRFGVVPVE
jgi:hypothetical protein